MAVKKYLDLVGLQTYNTQLKSTYLSVVNRVNTAKEGQTPVYRYDTKASTLNGVIPTANVTMDAGPSTDLSIATKKYVDDSVQGIASAMVFKGGVTATTASNTTTLTLGDTTLGDINKGYTFKFTANESGGDTFKIGDILIANEGITHTAADPITYNSSKWTLVPSGDDVDVTSVGVSNAEDAIITLHTSNSKDAAITSSGTLSAAHSTSGVTAGKYGSDSAQTPAFGGTASIPYVTVNATGHVTAAGTANVTIPDSVATDAALGLVKVDTANGISLDANNKLSVNVDGTIITNTSGTISAADASTTAKGVVKVGNNIDVAEGTISVAIAESTSGKLGVVKAGTNVTINGTTGAVSVATGGATESEGTVTTTLGVLAPDYNSIQATSGVISVNTVATSDITALFA